MDWGKWYLKGDGYSNAESIDTKIEGLLEKCTKVLENWRVLANDSEVIISVSAYLNNWNRELNLSPRTLQLLSDRNIALKIDVYFWEEDESQASKEE